MTAGASFGIIGFGPIARRIACRLREQAGAPELVALLVRDRSREAATEAFGAAVVCTDLRAFIARRPVVAVESASAAALVQHGPELLRAGIDLMPLSLGAFADPANEHALLAAAELGPGRLEIPAGALGSLGLLAAGRECGLREVVLRVSYPVQRWAGMGAGRFIDLDAVRQPTPFLRGTVRHVVSKFPGHLNVSVAVALAGLGLDHTELELVADPGITQAVFELTSLADAGPVSLRIGGRDAPVDEDPIDYTTFSVLRLLRRRQARVAI